MKTLFILSPLSQFEVTNLIGLNAPILGHLNLTLTNFFSFDFSYFSFIEINNLIQQLLVAHINLLAIVGSLTLLILGIISLSSLGGKIVEGAHKALTAAASATVVYSFFTGEDRDDKKDDDKNKKDSENSSNNNGNNNNNNNTGNNNNNNAGNNNNGNNNGNDTNNGNNNGKEDNKGNSSNNESPPKNHKIKMFNPKQLLIKEKIFRIVQFLKKIKNAIIFKYFNSSTGAIKHSFLLGFILNKLEIGENGQIFTGNNSQSDFYLGIFIITLICLLNVINLLGYIISNYLISKYEIETKFPKLKRLIKYFGKSSLFFILFEGIMCILFLIFMMVASYILMNK